jgi:drug/metabolite transporter (DMT)-like permease
MGSSTFSGAEALRALAAAALGGAAWGVAYSLTRPTLRKLGTLGAYLTGVVCVIAYGGSLVAVAPIAFGETLIEDRVGLFAFLVMAVLFGLIIGHQLFRDVES